MPLQPGTRLGPYEITAQIGAGGMGEVYQATDTKLKRQVAIKVLPESVAADSERLARFQREAEVLASLNHPNIAAIYGLEDADGSKALVMELVEGPTLADRIAHGPIRVADALPIARQIAEALEAAHEQGIIHRDLKPANVKVRDDGTVKVLDFGLAKAMAPAGAMSASASMSPTITTPAMTEMGMILGTAAYMAPEQAKGRPVDKRADVWAFGVMLFEMLTGTRAFAGDDTSEVLAGVIKSEPDWQALPALPPLLDTFLRQCLKKDPKQRLADMQDMRLALEGAFEAAAPPQAASIVDAPPAWRRIAVPGATLLVLAGAAAGWWLLGSGTSANGEVSRFEIKVSESGLDAEFGSPVILSPDGQTLAYATDDGVWARRLESAEPRRVVEGPVDNPVFSPDGRWIAYEQGGTLWRVPVTGGSPLRVADAPGDRGTFWAEADTILLSPQIRGAIVRVRIDGGGEPEPVTELQGDEVTHRWPQLLPGGRAVLFTAHRQTANFDNANLVVRDLTTGDQRVVFSGGFYGRYVPTGHLVYANGPALFAVPFDLAGLTVTGTSVPVLGGVRASSGSGGAHYHFSDNGTLVYVPATGDDLGGDSSGNWAFVDRDGTLAQSWATGGFSYGPALSPDGTRLVATVSGDEGGQDLWSWDRGRAAATRITFEDGTEVYPVWVPGGRELIFSANPDGNFRLYRAHADGSGGREPLPDPHEGDEMPQSISADGRWLLTRTSGADGRRSLQVRDLSGSEAPRVVVTAEDSFHSAALSSDAAWIAYDSNESGEWEVYAMPFLAEDGNKVAVSVGGGGMPHWSRDGRNIFYRSVEGVMVVDMAIVDGGLRPGVPRTLFEGDFSGGVVGYPYGESGLTWFDAAADGETFVLRQQAAGASQTNAIIIFNWFEELKRLVPVR